MDPDRNQDRMDPYSATVWTRVRIQKNSWIRSGCSESGFEPPVFVLELSAKLHLLISRLCVAETCPQSKMSERKVLNKYYPPDFDPSKIPKCKEPRNKTFCIRLMAPCNMRCTTCGEYIYKVGIFCFFMRLCIPDRYRYVIKNINSTFFVTCRLGQLLIF